MKRRVPLLLVLSCCLPGASVAGPAFVDLVDYPRREANWDRFHDLQWRLQRGFDQICGDTVCEGEYSDVQALRLRCSVDAARGTLAQCRWAFAASDLQVDGENGQLQARQPTWLCTLPLAPGTTVEAFFAALAGRDPLRAPLPGTGGSIFEGLFDCLN